MLGHTAGYYDGVMLPSTTDNGARLAAILPTGLASLAVGLGHDPTEMLRHALGDAVQVPPVAPAALPPVRSFVLLVVDGLGWSNLQAVRGHAKTLASMAGKRLQTVLPSTTGAALTTLTTGRLPGTHGLIGYRIRHPDFGLRSTLKEWHGISEVRQWQRASPLFGLASRLGARAIAVGRPAHATGGLTSAILSGAEYLGGQTIAERFALVSRELRAGDPLLAYLYVDELDRAAHSEGWGSRTWVRRLEALDAALDDLLRTLPGDVGVAVTADHGMIDVAPEQRWQLDADPQLMRGVAQIGGEPRLRSLYIDHGADPVAVAERFSRALGKRAWVGVRDEAISGGWFGPVDDVVAARLGEVLVAARGQSAYTLTGDSPQALAMVGQHGGLSDDERGVPLLLGGALAETGFVAAVTEVAAGYRR